MKNTEISKAVRQSRFPKRIFFGYYGALLILSGVHIGLLLGVQSAHFNEVLIIVVILLFWAAVAGGLTLYTRQQVKRTYEIPMQRLADAAGRIASGDFSVRIEPFNENDTRDYLDVMIDDFNKMAAELGNIETLRVDFFSNVSHEIKTPIAIIQNSAEMLGRPGLTEQERLEYAGTVTRAAKRLNTLITNILKLNKLENQSTTPRVSRFDLSGQLIRSALLFEPVWEEKDINFEANIADERRMINGDEELLPLVWDNLLSNAFKFTDKGGTVTLREYSENGRVIVEVEDSGCGMDEQTKKHIFDKFYQGDTSHSTEGNGLGLALAMRVIQISGGDMEVKSEPAKGTVFIVSLPDSPG